MSEELIKLFEDAKDTHWICGRRNLRMGEGICVRLTETDRAEIVHALRKAQETEDQQGGASAQ